MEAHSLKVTFCNNCGDYFARTDALERHHRKLPRKCVTASPGKAKEKRSETQRAHEESKERLLRAGRDIGMPLSQIIKEKYPDSSKKRTGGQQEWSRLKGR